MSDRTRTGRLIAGEVYYLGDRRIVRGETYRFSGVEMNHLAGHPAFEFDHQENVAETSEAVELPEQTAETSEVVEGEAA